MLCLTQGDWVWLDSDIGVPIGAKVKEPAPGRRVLVDDEGKEHRLSPELEASLRLMHPTAVDGVDDMIRLGDMDEASVLRNLMLRHRHGIIYTYAGSVLVAVNPYQNVPIYTDQQVRLYHGRQLGELPPHIFAIAESCYYNMKRRFKNQCCIISGESGAGKTESTKLILQYLAAISGELSKKQIEKQILESNPILEAFGNAKTIRNDNSSRFGKYLEIFFNKHGVIEGARIEQYLLEKSRVCHQAAEERNYHIFYCMLAGITEEERKALSLGNAEEYNFLSKGDCVLRESREDARDFKRLRSALKVLTFSESKSREILKLLAAILHLGNVYFEAITQDNLETSDVTKSQHFSIAASLLEVRTSTLANSLTHRSFMTSRERVTKPLSSEQAADSRDAFVKAVYNKLFIWIVGKINSVIYKTLTNSSRSFFVSIGLLDIFGFENFETNSFEQLCINFANEKLQQFFLEHVFKLEQKEYLKEDIKWKNIRFSDNQDILDLLAGKPCNVLSLIDEESNFPKGTDITMLNKLNQHHRQNQSYIASRTDHDTDFGIRHYCGAVHYDSRGFLEKNRDAVSANIVKMLSTSTNKLLRQIFEAELSASELKTTNNRRVTITPSNSLRVRERGRLRRSVPTLGGQFRQSLDSLMRTLSVCQPFFIRCFKPNNDKQPKRFDRELCLRQLRYSGMMDTVHIRNLGFPIRHTFAEFLERYRVLLKMTEAERKTAKPEACCEAICRAVILRKEEWKIGRTKVFLKDAHDGALEVLRDQELNRKALVVQRVMLAHTHRKSFLRKRAAAVLLQRTWRAYRARKELKTLRRGYERLVSVVRSRRLRRRFERQQAAAVTIQTQIRGYLARKELERRREAYRLETQSPEDLLVLELQQRLEEVIAEATQSIERSSLISELTSEISVQESEDSTSQFEMEEPTESPEKTPITIVVTPPTKPTTNTLEQDDDDDDDDPFSFYKFSRLYFQNGASHSHTSQRLKEALLPHDDEGDEKACLTISWIILRFMGDIPEQFGVAPQASSLAAAPHMSVQQARKLSALVGLDQIILRRNKKKHGGGNRKGSALSEELENLTEDEDIMIGEGPTLDRTLTLLEKLHVIVGFGLSRPDIRDEIYCQICKQLVKNQNSKSHVLGWVLLSVCLGIFPPTDVFLKYLESFVRKGPSGYREYCTERLTRIVANRERRELPCWIELQAATEQEPIDVSVALVDGRNVTLELDSASTAGEICQAVAEKIGLRDSYGFSVYISFQDKMWSLGSGATHVLDAVSQCEQEMRRQGKQERDTTWKLSIRKELFRPWHSCQLDPVSTDLIYNQIIKGIKSGEYVSEKEDDYVQLAAKHYFVHFGSKHSRDNVQKVVDDCISTASIENKSLTRWVQLISTALPQRSDVDELSKDKVKAELVDLAREKWRVHFSKFYEVTMTSGPPLPKSRFFVAVNWSGVFFMEGRDGKLLEIPYIEIKNVGVGTRSMTLTTVGQEYILKSESAADMAALIQENLEGLRQRSIYALVQSEVSRQDDPTWLACKRGDLLLVDKSEESSPDQDWIVATNQRTTGTGRVSRDWVQILPTLSRPSDEMLKLLSSKQKKVSKNPPAEDEAIVVAVSLKEFAIQNFRPEGKVSGRDAAFKTASKDKLWVWTREPLRQPLLKTLVDSELSSLACNTFTAILKYMGDYPIKHVRSPLDLTDQIFSGATQHEALRDEIYCQIMRQMTNNSSRLSLERGWQLLWLCSGLFPPSQSLMKHAQRFLQSRPKEQLSADCLQRMQEMCSKEPRKLPPHTAEVEAIQQSSTKMYQKIYFPNDTNQIFEVKSATTSKDLCHSIAAHLKLNSADGFGLYLKTTDKITSLEEQKYFFDSLRPTQETPKKGKKLKEVNQANTRSLVICKRKLWFNVSPGKDLVADLTFHFPQEMSKYLRGYHVCTREDMIRLGGLLFRARVDSDRSQFVMIPVMLKDLVPADQLQLMKPDDWKKHIISSYKEQGGISVEEAKVAFLRAISSWPTFGCAFFQVKQTIESSYPNTLLFSINKKGVTLIDPKTKEPLVMHPFSRIIQYGSKGSSFQMTISTLVRGIVFVCETAQAHAMEDLFRSYISMYEAQTTSFQQKGRRFS
ncbi:unconventional myosin-VIIa-like [Salarias fasciatus]|uniref:unconventional myosin-VIIa-like n=1 Tax=Salarias fasciatus TaxID=181472 RepID=UPI001176A105|nr:unconventional myosin-VIIa-like [Salarias fasciatus]